jgi:hypothetical protein
VTSSTLSKTKRTVTVEVTDVAGLNSTQSMTIKVLNIPAVVTGPGIVDLVETDQHCQDGAAAKNTRLGRAANEGAASRMASASTSMC